MFRGDSMKSVFIILIIFSLFISGCELVDEEGPQFRNVYYRMSVPTDPDAGYIGGGGGGGRRGAVEKSGGCSSLTNVGECVVSLDAGWSHFVCTGENEGLCDNVPGFPICGIPGENCEELEAWYPDCQCITEGGPICGDAILNQASEECDGGDLNGESCIGLGYLGGHLDCYGAGSTNECTFDISNCDNCGDGVVDTDLGEECDLTNLDGESCTSLGFENGILSCYNQGMPNDCTLDTSECVEYQEICGDGLCEVDENCNNDREDCQDRQCLEPTCVDGCGENFVPNRGTDESCNNGYHCNGAGTCVQNVCGDGYCDIGENPANCQADCSCSDYSCQSTPWQTPCSSVPGCSCGNCRWAGGGGGIPQIWICDCLND
jgi:hypothetical protein